MYLPHQIVGQLLQQASSTRTSASTTSAAWSSPRRSGDPGWFGPGSAVWHVHSHMQALIFGLQCAAYIERLDPSIYWMGMHHSRLVKRDDDGTAVPVHRPGGCGGPARPLDRVLHRHRVRLDRDRRATRADRCARCTTRSRAPGPTARATTPTTPTGCAGTTRRWCGGWRPRTSSITHSRCAARRSTATTASSSGSGTRSAAPTCRPPRPRHSTACSRICRRLAVTHGTAMATGPDLPMPQGAVDWAIRDTMPKWAAQMIGAHQPEHRRTHRPARSGVGRHQRAAAPRPAPSPSSVRRRPGCRRAPTGAAHAADSYVPGSDPVRSRDEVEHCFAWRLVPRSSRLCALCSGTAGAIHNRRSV